MPRAEIIFDRFHIVSKMNEAVDEIRRADQKHYKDLKGYKYQLLKNNAALSERQRDEVNMLS